MADAGGAIDSFFGSIQSSFQQSREKSEAGIDFATQTELYRYPVNDPEITKASDDYFAMLATLSHSLTNILKWRQEISALVQTMHGIATFYGTAFPPWRPMAGEVNNLHYFTTELHTAKDQYLDGELEQILQETLYLIKGKLNEINTLRSTALRLQYRVEQLEKIDMDSAGGKAIKLAGGENWLTNTRTHLATAKPEFTSAVAGFEVTFADLRKQAFDRIQKLDRQLLNRVANLDKQPEPTDTLEYGDLNEILSVYQPKPK
jgi:hypothetical protein